MRCEIIYSLNKEDAQTVAMETLGRKLAGHEMSALEEILGEHINWFDAISKALNNISVNKPT